MIPIDQLLYALWRGRAARDGHREIASPFTSTNLPPPETAAGYKEGWGFVSWWYFHACLCHRPTISSWRSRYARSWRCESTSHLIQTSCDEAALPWCLVEGPCFAIEPKAAQDCFGFDSPWAKGRLTKEMQVEIRRKSREMGCVSHILITHTQHYYFNVSEQYPLLIVSCGCTAQI